MNTTKNGMRALLASAAAGALVLGSAAGVMADEETTPTVPTAPVAQVVKLQKVDIHRHKPINVDKARDLKVRLTVRTTPGTEVANATVELAKYTKKVNGKPSDPALAAPLGVEGWVITHNADKSVWTLKGAVPAKSFTDLGLPVGETPAAIPDGASALLCISTVDLKPAVTAYSTQTMRRLGTNVDGSAITKKPVRECVKVYNPKAKPAKPAKR